MGDLDGDRESTFMDIEILLRIDENVLELGCDDDCINLRIY